MSGIQITTSLSSVFRFVLKNNSDTYQSNVSLTLRTPICNFQNQVEKYKNKYKLKLPIQETNNLLRFSLNWGSLIVDKKLFYFNFVISLKDLSENFFSIKVRSHYGYSADDIL